MTLPTWPAYSGDAPNRSQPRATFNENMAAGLAHFLTVIPDGADQFALDLIAAAAAANPTGTSTTSLAVGTGSKSLTIQAGRTIVAGMFATLADAAAPTTNYMFGQVTSYDFATGALVFNAISAEGSGTLTSWLFGLSGPQGPEGSPYPSIGSNNYKVLSVNAGATDVEWFDPRWVQISTASPSGASETAFTSLADPGYTDLLIRYSLTPSGSTTLLIDQSGPGTPSYGGADAISAATANQTNGVIEIRDYNQDFGLWQIAFYQPASWTSPDVATSTVPNQMRLVTGGLNAVKLRPTSGTFTGTITIYGRR